MSGRTRFGLTSMNSRRHTNLMRKIATIAAIILLLGQTIVAAHVHRATFSQELAAGGGSGIADSSCGICAAQLHSPAVSAVVPALDAPTLLASTVSYAVQNGPISTFVEYRYGRSPPASI
jgi:hypothetical protein